MPMAMYDIKKIREELDRAFEKQLREIRRTPKKVLQETVDARGGDLVQTTRSHAHGHGPGLDWGADNQ